MKYLKWVFGTNIANKDNANFEINKVITADRWDPTNPDWDQKGGFNFTNEKCALRWMSRGDTLYEVEIPTDGEIYKIENMKTPDGIIIANKIILKNPKKISDDLLNYYYEISELPLKTYFECIGLLASRSYYDLALRIIKDKITMYNIDFAINEFNDSIKPWHKVDYDCYNKVKEVLEEIKSSTDISICISKEPYIKQLSEDRIINLTGQSGSGKSYYAKQNFNTNDYEIIDTDDVFSEKRFNESTGLNRKLGEYFRNKYNVLPNLSDDFDLIYNEIVDYCKNIDKTIVIDCAQFHCCKDVNILKGKIIIIRTDIDTCYNRAISRWIESHKLNNWNYTEEELNAYKERKQKIYLWYKGSNDFIRRIDEI